MKQTYTAIAYVFVACLAVYAIFAYFITTVNVGGTYDGLGRQQYDLPQGFRIQSIPNLPWLLFDFVLYTAGISAIKYFFKKANQH